MYFREISTSQQDFFKMLDEKIQNVSTKVFSYFESALYRLVRDECQK